jgi:4'-phosphopantetheinyl transferase
MIPARDMSLRFNKLSPRDLSRTGTRINPAEDEVDVWGFLLDADHDLVLALHGLLSAEERSRVDCLVSEQHRTHRIVAFGALRTVLSRYEDGDPRTLRVERTPQGKPVLVRRTGGGEPVRFNLTHSHGRALIAVASSRDVGIDLEMSLARRNVVALARRFLPLEEQAAIERADEEAQQPAFLRFWVAREAALKADGTGLGFPLNTRRVELSADETEGRLIGRAPHAADSNCTIRFLSLESGWFAAVAAGGTDWRVRLCPPGGR